MSWKWLGPRLLAVVACFLAYMAGVTLTAGPSGHWERVWSGVPWYWGGALLYLSLAYLTRVNR